MSLTSHPLPSFPLRYMSVRPRLYFHYHPVVLARTSQGIVAPATMSIQYNPIDLAIGCTLMLYSR